MCRHAVHRTFVPRDAVSNSPMAANGMARDPRSLPEPMNSAPHLTILSAPRHPDMWRFRVSCEGRRHEISKGRIWRPHSDHDSSVVPLPHWGRRGRGTVVDRSRTKVLPVLPACRRDRLSSPRPPTTAATRARPNQRAASHCRRFVMCSKENAATLLVLKIRA